MKLFYLFPLFLFFCIPKLPAQYSLEMASNLVLEGEIALLQKKYNKALRLFNKALKIKPDLRAAQRSIGLCYDLQNNPVMALRWYLEVIEHDPFFSRVLYYQIGEAFYKIGEYDRAVFYFDKFDFLQSENDTKFTVNGEKERLIEQDLTAQLEDAIRACQVSMDSVSFRDNVQVLNLGFNINTRTDEYFPFLSNNQRILFYTKRKGTDKDENLYVSIQDKRGWKKGTELGPPLNSDKNEGMSTMVRDGRTMYFTACYRENVQGPCDIWEATVDGTFVKDVHPIQGDSNTPAWESQAAVSCDGRTLYFASMWDGPGHQGGSDIWYAKKLPNGLWGKPTNMGPKINTPKDEESPFITNDGRTLYFCSTGHLGLGGADIFMSMVNSKEAWTMPINLGPAVNSPYEEIGFFMSADGRTGYFASDRPGGYGGLDIYKVLLSEELTSEPITFVEGFVKDEYSGIDIYTLVTLDSTEYIRTDRTGRFFLCLPANSALRTNISVDEYHPFEKYFLIPESDNKSFYQLDLNLRPLKEPAPMIKALEPEEPEKPKKEPSLRDTTRAEAAPRMRTLERYSYTVLFKFDTDEIENNEIANLEAFIRSLRGKDIQRIEINGYADDIGEDRYNLQLSEDRAKKIALYLYEKGFVISKIAMRGYGEVYNDQPKFLNRRVELKVFALE